MSQEFLEPWTWLLTADDGRGLSRELARETAPGHPLYGVATRAIVRSEIHDADVLYELLDGSGRVAYVHLSWNVATTPDYPHTELFDDLDHWRRTSMPEDHKEWLWRERLLTWRPATYRTTGSWEQDPLSWYPASGRPIPRPPRFGPHRS